MIQSVRLFVRWTAYLVLAAAFGAGLGGCDNPNCIYGENGCQSDSAGAIGSEPAAVPSNHTWLRSGAPTLTSVVPNGTTVHPDTPIVLVFSESMSVSSLQNAFRLEFQGGFGTQPVPIAQSALVGDGRMFVMFPATALLADTAYTLRYADDAVVADLQGTPLDQPSDKQIADFDVGTTPPTTPKVLANWPPDNSTNQSSTGEIVVVFDRRVNAGTVDTDSFDITVDGAPPTFDPLPQALLSVSAGIPVTDTRVYRFRSVDSDGEAVDLGQNVDVAATLSPTGHRIKMQDASQLAEIKLEYSTASFAAPSAAELVSLPVDAIGIGQLTGGNTKVPELEIALTVDDGQPSDVLGVFIFGTKKGSSPAQLAALYREFDLGDVPYDSNTHIATIKESELDLASSTSPLATRLADGTVYFAFRRQRGSVASPVRLLDTDPDRQGVQSAVLDTKAPTLTGFGLTGSDKSNFRGDVRNFALVGRASERLEAVEITTTLGDNGNLSPVVASNSSGLFVAQPFTQVEFLDPLDPAAGNNPLDFTVTLYDRALNDSSSTNGTFTQVGAVGTGNSIGASVTVEVFDATTLATLAGVNVFTHEDFLLTVDPLDTDTTDANGLATLDAATFGDTLVTVDAPGYDLTTIHAVQRDRVSIALQRTSVSRGTVDGLLSSGDSNVTNFERVFADSRKFEDDETLADVQVCSVNPTTASFECAFGPYDVVPSRIGAVSVGVIDTPASEFSYTAAGFLKGFRLEAPVKQTSVGGSQDVDVSLPTLLDDPATPLEDQPIDGPQTLFDASAATGIDLNALDGTPRVFLESPIPALMRNGVVGFGVAFDQGGDVWKLRSAFPGEADPTDTKYPGDVKGDLVLDGTIDPDLRLHGELRDTHGARVGRRTPMSNVGASLDAPSAPALLVPTPGSGSTGTEGFDLEFENSIPDALGMPGLYRVTLVDDDGRAWRIFVADPDDSAPTVRCHAPDLPASGGVGLADGTISCTVEAFAWSGFAWDSFFWTDIGRDHDVFAASAPFSFSKP
ncbi:MAG: Ig-like domain-containing protein [Planctomycetes bacterium]|nr:Ig-like domain-containing protein [Planctomycetota bacterium]